MSELYEKSLKKLELDAVLEKLADCAVSQEGKQRCRELRPLTDARDIEDLQRQTSAACRLITLKGAPGFQQVQDVRPSLDRADRGGCLNPVELLHIAGVLRCARMVKDYSDGDGDSSLSWMFAALTPNKYLEEKIYGSILSEDEIADSASTELADIRRLLAEDFRDILLDSVPRETREV